MVTSLKMKYDKRMFRLAVSFAWLCLLIAQPARVVRADASAPVQGAFCVSLVRYIGMADGDPSRRGAQLLFSRVGPEQVWDSSASWPWWGAPTSVLYPVKPLLDYSPQR